MPQSSYFEYIFQVEGESIRSKPENVFDSESVYLIIDLKLNLIWIWAGSHSRLFQRYMAANWAGKLKSRKKFYDFKYEVVKQGREPKDFLFLIEEINNGDTLEFPGQTREKLGRSKILNITQANPHMEHQIEPYALQSSLKVSSSNKIRIKQLISEIKEIQMQIKY